MHMISNTIKLCTYKHTSWRIKQECMHMCREIQNETWWPPNVWREYVVWTLSNLQESKSYDFLMVIWLAVLWMFPLSVKIVYVCIGLLKFVRWHVFSYTYTNQSIYLSIYLSTSFFLSLSLYILSSCDSQINLLVCAQVPNLSRTNKRTDFIHIYIYIYKYIYLYLYIPFFSA